MLKAIANNHRRFKGATLFQNNLFKGQLPYHCGPLSNRPISVAAINLENLEKYERAETNPFPYLFLNSSSIQHLAMPRSSSI